MEIELYVYSLGGRERAITRNIASNIRVQAIKEHPDGKQEPVIIMLDEDWKIEAQFPDGKWHKAVFMEKATGEHKEAADLLMWKNGVYSEARYGRAWALTLLESWTFTNKDGFPLPMTEAAYNTLCSDVLDLIEAEVIGWKDSFFLPGSVQPWTFKSAD